MSRPWTATRCERPTCQYVPTDLRVIGEVAAGRPFAGTIKTGEAVRIFTGGEVPAGADAIVIQENTTRTGRMVIVTALPQAGRHIRTKGLDFNEGEVLLTRGRILTGRDLGLAAAMNYPLLPVHRKARVALLATGDELVVPGEQPGPGQIVYSNGYPIMTLARQENAEVTDLGIVQDRVEDTVAAIRKARDANADVLVTMGGASVGDYDLVQKALAAEGIELVVLEDRDAAGPPDDARQARKNACPRSAGKSGFCLCLRVPVSASAFAQARRPGRCNSRNRACIAGFRPAGQR